MATLQVGVCGRTSAALPGVALSLGSKGFVDTRQGGAVGVR